MRPMIFTYPSDPRFADESGQFLFGPSLLVAPVLHENATTKDITLPSGVWYDFWTGHQYKGGGRITVDAPLARIPLLAKAGAIIPTQQIVQYSDEAPIDPLTFIVFPDTAGKSTAQYYEDDGVSFDYRSGKYLERTIEYIPAGARTRIVLSQCNGSYQPPARAVVYQVFNQDSTAAAVSINGKRLSRVAISGIPSIHRGWAYDSSQRAMLIKIGETKESAVIEITR
jgi:alpha-glucosidase